MKNYLFLQQKYLTNTYVNRGLVLTFGKGVYLYDIAKKRYLDLSSNYGVNVFGYNCPPITKALTKQIEKLTTLHCSFNNDRRSIAALKLCKRCNMDQVYFSNSGTEAIEAALKFAVLATGKSEFISMQNAYHGKTLGSLTLTANYKYKKPFVTLVHKFKHVPFGNIKKLKNAINQKTAGVFVEPIQGEGGIILPPRGYLKEVETLCKKRNVLLIVDEIQTGCGRTGKFLAIEHEDISPDIISLGKGLAGGIPIGATLVTKTIGESISKGIHTSTFGGNPLACAGVIAVLDALDDKIMSYIKNIGSYLKDSLKNIKSKKIVGIRGKGLMVGIEVNRGRDAILKEFQRNGIIVIPAAENVVRLLPPFIIKKEHIDQFLIIFNKALDSA